MDTDNRKRLANDFPRTIWGLHAGQIFTVQSLHEKIQFEDQEIQGPEDYSVHLRIAIHAGWIEPVAGELDTYRITRQKRSKHGYYDLMHKILCAVGLGDSVRRLQSMAREICRMSQQEAKFNA